MPMRMVADRAAGSGAYERLGFNIVIARRVVFGLLVGPLLAGCVTTTPQAGTHPADPGAKVAGVGYRSTIAPYVSLRPVSPVGWKDQNRRVAPTPKNEQ